MKRNQFTAFLLTLSLGLVLSLSYVFASTLSASKTLDSGTYCGARIKMTPQASCPNSGTFSWTLTQSQSVTGSTTHTAYTKTKKWTKSGYKATFKWTYGFGKLPTGGSGTTIEVKTGSASAKFTYNPSTKALTVQ